MTMYRRIEIRCNGFSFKSCRAKPISESPVSDAEFELRRRGEREGWVFLDNNDDLCPKIVPVSVITIWKEKSEEGLR